MGLLPRIDVWNETVVVAMVTESRTVFVYPETRDGFMIAKIPSSSSSRLPGLRTVSATINKYLIGEDTGEVEILQTFASYKELMNTMPVLFRTEAKLTLIKSGTSG